jgi:mRNA-degrading endonuclease RelE of RelBE toxin-antitoxin system
MTKKREIQTLPRFDKSLKRLAKHFPKVKHELAELALHLESDELLGDKVPNVNFDVYKVRLANPDAQKGKSGGFRVIYYLELWKILLMKRVKNSKGEFRKWTRLLISVFAMLLLPQLPSVCQT